MCLILRFASTHESLMAHRSCRPDDGGRLADGRARVVTVLSFPTAGQFTLSLAGLPANLIAGQGQKYVVQGRPVQRQSFDRDLLGLDPVQKLLQLPHAAGHRQTDRPPL